MGNKEFLNTLHVCGMISERAYHEVKDMDVDIKWYCTEFKKCYNKNSSDLSEYEMMLNILISLYYGFGNGDKIKEIVDICKLQYKYRGEMDLNRLAALFITIHEENYKIINELRFLRVADVTSTKIKGKQWGFIYTNNVLYNIMIDGKDTGYSACFITDGKEEWLKGWESDKIIYKLVHDNYDVVRIGLRAVKNRLIGQVNLEKMKNSEFLELIQILSIFNFYESKINKDKYFEVYKGNNRLVREVIRKMIQSSEVRTDTIIDFAYSIKDLEYDNEIVLSVHRILSTLVGTNIDHVFRELSDKIKGQKKEIVIILLEQARMMGLYKACTEL